MFRIRMASAEDNAQLIELTAASPMPGDIGLTIHRNPDFFKLAELRGKTTVFVAEKDGVIVGTISVTNQQVLVGGVITPLWYIGDFKVAAPFQQQGLGMNLCDAMAEFIIAQGADLAFLNVSYGNKKPLGFFRNRQNIPDFDNIGLFHVYQFIGKKTSTSHFQYHIEKSSFNEELISFYREQYCNHQLGPFLVQDESTEAESFIVRSEGRIIAALTLFDTMSFKQNVITAISWRMRVVLKLVNVYGAISGLSVMPAVNQPVKMLYIRYLAVKDLDRSLVRVLIRFASNITYEKQYSFVSLGLHERDPLMQALSGLPKMKFKSVGMLVSIKNNRQLIDTVKNGIPYEDYSLV